MNRICACKGPKTHLLIFDGGSLGEYTLSVCEPCYSDMDRKFLIKEEELDESL
jgi:hypothetical protein